MQPIKSYLAFALIIPFFLTGCGTYRQSTKEYYGTITSVEKISDVSYAPGGATAVGAISGAGSGVAIGTFVGGLAGVAISIGTFGLLTPVIPALMLEGAVIGGAAGTAVGGIGGYATDVYQQGNGLYSYTIQIAHSQNFMVVNKYESTPFEVGDYVHLAYYCMNSTPRIELVSHTTTF